MCQFRTTFSGSENIHRPQTTIAVPNLASPAWTSRLATIEGRFDGSPIDVLFVGDSITERWESDGRQPFDKYFSAFKTLNAGKGADRTQHTLWRLQQLPLSTICPTACVLMVGTNNVRWPNADGSFCGSDTPADIVAGQRAIIDLLQKTFSATIIFTSILPRADDDTGGTMDTITVVNRENRRLYADAGHQVRYVDLTQEFSVDRHDFTSLTTDGLHLSGTGYERLAKRLVREIVRSC